MIDDVDEAVGIDHLVNCLADKTSAKGDGVIEDFVYAHMWLNIAASNGADNAKEGLKIIVKVMTSSKIEEAQRLARECVKKNYKGC